MGDNPTTTVCDDDLGMFGGVPAIDPPSFAPIQSIADAINDFACRFKDETGSPGGRIANSCVMSKDGQFNFVSAATTVQFCGLINRPFSFPSGETLVTVRIRDEALRVSAAKALIIRVTAQ